MATGQAQADMTSHHTDLENFTKIRFSFDLDSQNHFHASITVKPIEKSQYLKGLFPGVFVALFCIILMHEHIELFTFGLM